MQPETNALKAEPSESELQTIMSPGVHHSDPSIYITSATSWSFEGEKEEQKNAYDY